MTETKDDSVTWDPLQRGGLTNSELNHELYGDLLNSEFPVPESWYMLVQFSLDLSCEVFLVGVGVLEGFSGLSFLCLLFRENFIKHQNNLDNASVSNSLQWNNFYLLYFLQSCDCASHANCPTAALWPKIHSLSHTYTHTHSIL